MRTEITSRIVFDCQKEMDKIAMDAMMEYLKTGDESIAEKAGVAQAKLILKEIDEDLKNSYPHAINK